MMKTILAVGAAAALLAGASGAATPPAKQVAQLRRQVAALTGQVKTLKSQNAKLSAQVSTLEGQLQQAKLATRAAQAERDQARSALTQAQQGAAQAVGTMAASDVLNTILPVAQTTFRANGPRFTSDLYTAENYAQYTFTYCGYC
jgi:septal ring factor EnvC (AmiA/AmiB activator)